MKDEKELKSQLIKCLERFESEIYALNDFMAANPELGREEYKASQAIVELLRKNGIETEYPFAGFETGFCGKINPEKEKRAVILAEYDALQGMGHACGHCASGSSSVWAALALNEMRDELDFGIDIIGTPDEERRGAKCYMADDGIFDRYDFAAMVHMGPVSTVDVNMIALDGLNIRWHGKASHAASAPEEGINAFNAARLFFDAVDMMRQHIVQEARLHGYLRHAGTAANIVPDLAEVTFLARAPKRKDLNGITEWVKDCAKASAMATKTSVEIEPSGLPFHELYISDSGRKLMEECFKDISIEPDNGTVGMTGSSDIGNVDYHCPAFHPIMSIGKPYQCHTLEFASVMQSDLAHEAIKNSAEYLITLCVKLYSNDDLMEKIKKEHSEYRKG